MVNHALVIGGTGMLKDVSIHLSDKVKCLTVVGRSAAKMGNLKNCTNLNPILADYSKDNFADKIDEAMTKYGDISLVVSWIHATAPKATAALVDVLKKQKTKVKYVDVRSSSVANPSNYIDDRLILFEGSANINYHQVLLGFVVEAKQSRWLTHAEISAGVIEAIKREHEKYIVGQVAPWDLRP